MINTRLQTLLARTPLTEEDIYNVSVIFSALSSQRQMEILDNWEKFAFMLISERQRLDAVQQKNLIKMLKQTNTLLDVAVLRMQEKLREKDKMRAKIQENLAIEMEYDLRKKEKLIQEIASKR